MEIQRVCKKVTVLNFGPEIRSKYDSCLSLVKSTYLPTTYQFLKVMDTAAKSFLGQSEWKKAKECLIASIPACKRIFPPLWPMLGIQYYTLGKLEWQLSSLRIYELTSSRYIENDGKSAERNLGKAYNILSKLHESNHPFIQELSRTLGEVKEEVER